MFKITKEFHFSASHQLAELPAEHPCTRLHGHNYVVKVELSSLTLNKTGFVVDYRELDIIKRWIDDNLDHKHLNDFFGDINPSAENMAVFLFHKFNGLVKFITAVEISETPKTNCRYEP